MLHRGCAWNILWRLLSCIYAMHVCVCVFYHHQQYIYKRTWTPQKLFKQQRSRGVSHVQVYYWAMTSLAVDLIWPFNCMHEAEKLSSVPPKKICPAIHSCAHKPPSYIYISIKGIIYIYIFIYVLITLWLWNISNVTCP